MAAKDFNQVHSLVHNLKGLAGNLEATDLQAAAVAMEKLVKGQSEKTISDQELKSESDAVVPFCDKLVRLAEDFELDGIQKFLLNSGG